MARFSVVFFALCLHAQSGFALPAAVQNIQCAVCRFAVQSAASYVIEHHFQEEDSLVDLVDGLCSARKDEGAWIRLVDVLQDSSGAQLTIQKREMEGVCRQECKIVQQACAASMKGRESMLVALLLNGEEDIALVHEEVCSRSCEKTNWPRITSWANENFVPLVVPSQAAPQLVAAHNRCGSSNMNAGWIGSHSLTDCREAVLSISDCYQTYFFHAEEDNNCGCVQISEGLTDNCESSDQVHQAGVHIYRLHSKGEGTMVEDPAKRKATAAGVVPTAHSEGRKQSRKRSKDDL